jgi:hypothetical protein
LLDKVGNIHANGLALGGRVREIVLFGIQVKGSAHDWRRGEAVASAAPPAVLTAGVRWHFGTPFCQRQPSKRAGSMTLNSTNYMTGFETCNTAAVITLWKCVTLCGEGRGRNEKEQALSLVSQSLSIDRRMTITRRGIYGTILPPLLGAVRRQRGRSCDRGRPSGGILFECKGTGPEEVFCSREVLRALAIDRKL